MSGSLAIEPIELTKGLLKISIGVKVMERSGYLTARFAVLIITLHILFLLSVSHLWYILCRSSRGILEEASRNFNKMKY